MGTANPVGGECGRVFTFGLGGGGFICIGRSFKARRSIITDGDIIFGANTREQNYKE